MTRLLLLPLLLSLGAEVLQEIGPARLRTSAAQADGTLVTKFGAALVVEVRVEGDVRVEEPNPWTGSSGWRVRPLSSATDAHGWRRELLLDPLAPGIQEIQLEPLRIRVGREWRSIAWQPLRVNVQSDLAELDVRTLRDPTEIEVLPDRSAVLPWWPLLVAGSLLVALVTFFVWRRRPVPARQRSPRADALHELSRIERLRLPQRGKSEEFHTLLANVVRRYLERTLNVPASRRTTSEFLASLDSVAVLTSQQRAFLTDFLPRCDLAKFARADISLADAETLLQRTREFLDGTC